MRLSFSPASFLRESTSLVSLAILSDAILALSLSEEVSLAIFSVSSAMRLSLFSDSSLTAADVPDKSLNSESRLLYFSSASLEDFASFSSSSFTRFS